MSRQRARATGAGAYDSTVMPEDHLRFRVDLAKRIAHHDMVWPAADGLPGGWAHGAPLGNGDFGTVISGSPDNLTFVLGKTDIWDRSGPGRSDLATRTFAEFCKPYFDRDRKAFNALRRHRDYHAQHATTAGVFRLHLHDADEMYNAGMRVSLWDAVMELVFKPARHRRQGGLRPNGQTRIHAFVSRAYKVIAVRIRPSDFSPGAVWWELSRQPHPPHPLPVIESDERTTWLTQSFSTGDHYCVAVSRPAWARAAKGQWATTGVMDAKGTGEVVLFLTLVSSNDAADPAAEAGRRIRRAERAGYGTILKAHRRWWARYWKRGYVCVQDRALERWWYKSLYLCGSTIEPGCWSPGLQGVWIKQNVPSWFGDYTTDVNLQSTYWGLMTANRLDFTEPYVRALRRMAVNARRETRDYFSMRGLRFPLQGSVDGFELCGGPASWLGVSIGQSAWLVQLLWQIYQYSGDREFLERIAYPLMKDTVLFYQDYMTWDERAQRYVIEPSQHFETWTGKGFEGWGRNAMYDVAMVRMAFQQALEAARLLATDEDLQETWAGILPGLPELPTDPKKGVWVNYQSAHVLGGGHTFALAPAFPCELVSKWHGPRAWRRAAQATCDDPAVRRNSATGGAWCGGQGIRELIRLGRVREAHRAARWKDGQSTNGLEYAWNSPAVQANHTPGMCSVLNDMLLLAPGGVLRVFPCFPRHVPAAFHSLRAPGAFLVSAEKRGRAVDYVLIKSLKGNTLRMANPWPRRALRVRDTRTRAVLLRTKAATFELSTKRGQLVAVEPPGAGRGPGGGSLSRRTYD